MITKEIIRRATGILSNTYDYSCEKCDHHNIFEATQTADYRFDKADCELCGSHATVKIRVTCEKCDHSEWIEVYED
jgi:transcription elongation factor Elf1